MSPRFMVTGAGGPAGRSVTSWLRSQGGEVIGVDAAPAAVDGVACERVPFATDPDYGERLGALARRAGVTCIVPTVSEELPVLARHRGVLARRGVEVVVAGRKAVAVANDKLLTATTLARAGVAVPRFAVLGDGPGDARTLAELLGFPCLTKPRVGRGARGVAVHESPEQLPAGWPGEGSIAQEFVAGREYAVQLSVSNREATAVVLSKTELRDGAVGNARTVTRADREDVARLAIAAARAIGLRGPADVDVRERRAGEPVVLEVNARFGAWAAEAPEVLDSVLGAAFTAAVAA